jgi:hypothetical protein
MASIHTGNDRLQHGSNKLQKNYRVFTECGICGPICLGHKEINFSTVFAGQAVSLKEVHDDIWLVSFMDYDLGYFDLETRVLEPLENPFGPKVLPMWPVRSVIYVSGLDRKKLVGPPGFEPGTNGL